MDNKDRAREVLAERGIAITEAGGFMHRATTYVGPAVLEAMLAFAAQARTDALREAAEKLERKAQRMEKHLGISPFADAITEGVVKTVRDDKATILSLIPEDLA